MLRLEAPRALRIGRLGRVELAAGFYVYVGSALGPGGLAARLAHHERAAPNPRWHIDHLRRRAALREIWYTRAARRLECFWARALCVQRGRSLPLLGFGSSDCRCPSHLVRCEAPPSRQAFRRRLRATAPAHPPIRRLRL